MFYKYLAEDRILCFEIVSKKNEAWVLRYVKGAKAETDVPDRLPELISQRRRWLNGSFFAAVHSLLNWGRIYSSGHSFSRKIFFTLQFFYNLVSIVFSWFSVANFYLAFYVFILFFRKMILITSFCLISQIVQVRETLPWIHLEVRDRLFPKHSKVCMSFCWLLRWSLV